MRLALVHEHLAQDGGAENVLRAFQELYPSAPTFTLVHNRQRAHSSFAGKDIRTSFIQRLPGGIRHYQWYLALMPTAVESYDLVDYDVVLSSASAFAKGVLTRPDAVHLCYCHSPTRYLWTDSRDYVAALPYPRVLKAVIALQLTRLRQWDRLAADRVDHFMANSKTVKRRIEKYYRRESAVVYPPVATHRFHAAPADPGDYYITGGRLVPYKRFDLAVQAFNRLGVKLKVFGTGPEEKRLRAMAKGNIEFLGKVPDAELATLYSRALAFINPQEEDFGITAVEAMAAGRPVIAYARGGALETVVDGTTGTFFEEQAWEALADTVLRFHPERFRPDDIRAWADRFSESAFAKNIQAFVQAHSTVKP